MTEKIYFSEKLKLNYKIKKNQENNRVIVFEDQVNYSDKEIKILEKANNQVLKNVHNLKKIFNGVLI